MEARGWPQADTISWSCPKFTLVVLVLNLCYASVGAVTSSYIFCQFQSTSLTRYYRGLSNHWLSLWAISELGMEAFRFIHYWPAHIQFMKDLEVAS
ncbi:hypothetical protein SADUNF_Sadunf11G0003800 [Salix dunnii]|uniref:Uncharacterized protein n=1 Tax=Salix dunnii TaxID=1413687 RepID=A0A835MMJ2_9ROSI|nr:hypothetical protein SADUNF_Sadunf11G0003800 [Salix dunnii]